MAQTMTLMRLGFTGQLAKTLCLELARDAVFAPGLMFRR